MRSHRVPILLIFVFGFTVLVQGQISLSVSNAPIDKVFALIEQQSGYNFLYTGEIIAKAKPVTVTLRDASLNDALRICFAEQPLQYTIDDKHILVRLRVPVAVPAPVERMLRGKVVNAAGEGIAGVSVAVKGTTLITATNTRGEFMLDKVPDAAVLVISGAEMERQEIVVGARSYVAITIQPHTNVLDETVVIAYGKTTLRFATGSVSKVSRNEIARQPVTNALATLQGRVPGLVITQSNGLPGSSFAIQIRGQNSLKQGGQPLIIVDGVPFMLNTGTLSQVTPMDINNPLNSINPADIESIEVLKDADATAIYGSQAANGVLLITTRKGEAGRVVTNFTVQHGIGKVTRLPSLLHTPDYLAMRKEALANDAVVPDLSNAPDLLVWDSSAYTDWKGVLLGGTAKLSGYQLSISGGSPNTQFIFSANYNRETTVFRVNQSSERGNGRLQLNHSNAGNTFKLSFVSSYSIDKRKLPFNDLTQYIYLPPNTPALYDSSGGINWHNWVDGIDNPLAQQLTRYQSETNNWISNLLLQYRIIPGLWLKASAGTNFLGLQEDTKIPIRAQRPSALSTGTHSIATQQVQGYVLEPQLEYDRKFARLQLNALAGFSLQERKQSGTLINGSAYTNDDLLGSIAAAPVVAASNSSSQYNYIAAFARVGLRFAERYLLNLSARRDGSSRFGPSNRFSNFGSAGAGWIFSEEKVIKTKLPFLSFGKLRASYGVTGNDQIGDYQYLDAWSPSSSYSYQQNSGILPTRLFNPYYGWERTRKLEAALETGFLHDRLYLSVAYYRNRSDNQLVNYKLPFTTGFTTLLQNLDALIENTGFELALTSKVIQRNHFSWISHFNISIPRTRLVRYPGLDASTDRYNYIIGKPLTIQNLLHYTGIDPQTGIYQFADVNNDGVISSPNDLSAYRFTGPRLYGGLSHDISYQQWSLSIFFQFVQQDGRNYLSTLNAVPGAIGNQPRYILDRWQTGNDPSTVQRFTATATTAATAYYNLRNSDAVISEASFIRLKNVSVSYALPAAWIKRYGMSALRFYVQCQNLFTLTRYKGSDPETQSLLSLPPIRMIAGGCQITF